MSDQYEGISKQSEKLDRLELKINTLAEIAFLVISVYASHLFYVFMETQFPEWHLIKGFVGFFLVFIVYAYFRESFYKKKTSHNQDDGTN